MAGSDEPPPDPGEITRLLVSISEGDRYALNRLFPVVYAELRALAHRQLAHIRPGDTLQTTALVHEAYLKLLGTARPEWHDRKHFFAVASRAMRQISVDYARTRAAQKRGGNTPPLSLDEQRLPVSDRAHELVLLDLALTELESLSERPARVVELRFFGGLSVGAYGEARVAEGARVPLRRAPTRRPRVAALPVWPLPGAVPV
jgi:RNA polymerase sigma factor (TIGR02999 family)